MLLDFDLLVPAHTAKDEPATYEAKLTSGVVTEIRVYFPPGCATLVHVAIRDALHQLVPANPDGTLNFDDQLIIANLDYKLTAPPFAVTIYGWSPDAYYHHLVTVQFELKPPEGKSSNELLTELLEQLNTTEDT